MSTSCSFLYEACDVPPEQTLVAWRREQEPAPRRRSWLRLGLGRSAR